MFTLLISLYQQMLSLLNATKHGLDTSPRTRCLQWLVSGGVTVISVCYLLTVAERMFILYGQLAVSGAQIIAHK